jgi:hypothetical protein
MSLPDAPFAAWITFPPRITSETRDNSAGSQNATASATQRAKLAGNTIAEINCVSRRSRALRDQLASQQQTEFVLRQESFSARD